MDADNETRLRQALDELFPGVAGKENPVDVAIRLLSDRKEWQQVAMQNRERIDALEGETAGRTKLMIDTLRQSELPKHTAEKITAALVNAKPFELRTPAEPVYETDGAPAAIVLAAVRQCAMAWEPAARVLGNVRAGDIVKALNTLFLTGN